MRFGADPSIPVSYTHLLRDDSLKIIGAQGNIEGAKEVFEQLIALAERGNVITAVSYTHLDVYKRQKYAKLGRADFCKPRCDEPAATAGT